MLRDSYVRPLRTICITVTHVSVASSKPKLELDSQADMSVVTTVKSFMPIIDQLMSTVTFQTMVTKVPRQSML